jgi:hypothetical protein
MIDSATFLRCYLDSDRYTHAEGDALSRPPRSARDIAGQTAPAAPVALPSDAEDF